MTQVPEISNRFPQELVELIKNGEWSDLGEPLELTRQMIDDYARLSGDHNPIHVDEEVAKQRKFRTVVAHGMLLATLLPRLDRLYKPLIEDSGLNIIDREPKPDFCAFVAAGTKLRLRNRVVAYREKRGLGFLELAYEMFGDDIPEPVMKFSRTLVCSVPT